MCPANTTCSTRWRLWLSGSISRSAFPVIAEGLEAFRGAERRFQIKGVLEGEKNGILVVDDYGHHPTEIRATLAAAKNCGRRLVVLFQPHRYTRTAALREDFARSFYDADVVLLCDIYAASEDPIPGRQRAGSGRGDREIRASERPLHRRRRTWQTGSAGRRRTGRSCADARRGQCLAGWGGIPGRDEVVLGLLT